MNQQHFKSAANYRLIATATYFATVFLTAGFIIKFNPTFEQAWLPLLVWWAPLLPALPGIFTGKTYTYGWASFVLLFPFLYAFYYIMEPEKLRFTLSIVVLSVICFLCAMAYVKKYALAYGIKTNKDAKRAKGIEE